MKRRILSLGIACCLVFTALPGTAQAEGEITSVEEVSEEPVEEISVESEEKQEEQSEQTEPEEKEEADTAETPEEIAEEVPEQKTEETVSETPEQKTEEIAEETPAESEQDTAAEEPENAEDEKFTGGGGEPENAVTPETEATAEDVAVSEATSAAEDTAVTDEASEDTLTGEVTEQIPAEENAELSLLAAEPEEGIAVLAEDGEADVTSESELRAALKRTDINTINITKSFKYTYEVVTDKKIVVKNGVAFTWSAYKDTFKSDNLVIEEGGTFCVSLWVSSINENVLK